MYTSMRRHTHTYIYIHTHMHMHRDMYIYTYNLHLCVCIAKNLIHIKHRLPFLFEARDWNGQTAVKTLSNQCYSL